MPLLIEKGANISVRDDLNQTALFLAVQKNSESMVKLLIDNGADVNAKNRFNETSLGWAIQRSNH